MLVLGASGVLGQIAIQSAKLLGATRVVAAARSPEGLARCLELGADAAVRLDEPDDLPAALGEAAQGRIDVVLDPDLRRAVRGGAARGELRRPDRADRSGCGRRGDGAIGRDPRQDARDHGSHQLRRAGAGQARGIPAHGRGRRRRPVQVDVGAAAARAGRRGVGAPGRRLAPQDRARALSAAPTRRADTARARQGRMDGRGGEQRYLRLAWCSITLPNALSSWLVMRCLNSASSASEASGRSELTASISSSQRSAG